MRAEWRAGGDVKALARPEGERLALLGEGHFAFQR
jgi:hypothetical protein